MMKYFLNGGGIVIGVIPRFFKIKSTHTNGLTELIVVDSMRRGKRKWLCINVMLLEGFGTLEGFFLLLRAQLELSKNNHSQFK
jgi:hypothetical protein